MAARLTDRQKKKIVADYLELGSYNAAAKANGVSKDSVRRIVQDSEDFAQKAKQKKDENTADILAYMESQRGLVCDIIDKGLLELSKPGKFERATPIQITTALGTLIDKWSMVTGSPTDTAQEDDLSKSLKEMAERLESDDI